jgi:hypothetical protein
MQRQRERWWLRHHRSREFASTLDRFAYLAAGLGAGEVPLVSILALKRHRFANKGQTLEFGTCPLRPASFV